ncbi:23403_t:CDS:2 [Racocetra persica]|uniref:23403_t:CDS:1 n=1 Tax=Racocetra persica TaxID=160502 RepID=A0ACA9N598_9GLOM|nr:23403_t:CDS:2 [Racocetra persica]
MNEKNPNFSNNNFSGSLKALKNCRELEYVCIGYQTNIKGGLEYLPIEKLTYFAHPELMAKVKHPDKEKVIMELEEEITEKDKLVNELELKIADTKKELENVKTNEAEKTEKIARLESKLKELEKAKQNLENELKIERDHAKDLDE